MPLATVQTNCVAVFGNGNVMSKLQALECALHGVGVTGNDNTVENTTSARNGTSTLPDKGTGILFFGNDTTARNNRVTDNAHDGLAGTGDNLVFTGNVALSSTQCGVNAFGGSAGTIERNHIRSSGKRGICLQGSGHAAPRTS